METEVDVLPPQADAADLELGEMLGSHYALSTVAGHCSASQAACLRRIRDERAYQITGLDWSQFCSQRLGMTRRHADRLIRNLNEFGPGYFELSQIVRISPEVFRKLAGSISSAGMAIEGEIVPIRPENAQRICDAVEALRAAAPNQEKTRIDVARSKLEACLELLHELAGRRPQGDDRERLQDLIAHGLRELTLASELV